jgi:predicted metalloprotease
MVMTSTSDSGLALITMCAHEFGHIHQYWSSYKDNLTALDRTAKPMELHADFLAGFYLADRKTEHPEFKLQTVGALFEQIGDTNFTSPRHHGTSAERIAAITAGFELGKTPGRRIDAAAEAGVHYIERNVYGGR